MGIRFLLALISLTFLPVSAFSQGDPAAYTGCQNIAESLSWADMNTFTDDCDGDGANDGYRIDYTCDDESSKAKAIQELFEKAFKNLPEEKSNPCNHYSCMSGSCTVLYMDDGQSTGVEILEHHKPPGPCFYCLKDIGKRGMTLELKCGCPS